MAQGAKKPASKPGPKPVQAVKAPAPTIFQTGPFDSLGLLMKKEVQAELKITDAQLAALKAGPKTGGRVGPEPGENRKKINKVLTIAQQQRYQEIVLQRQGIRIATLQEVSRAIGLSNNQLNQMYKVIGEVNEKNMDMASMEISEAEMKRRSEKNNATVEPNLMAVLTPAQRAKWQQLLGKPFRLG
jgi:hypothetical protein